jgi:hypothetical protein
MDSKQIRNSSRLGKLLSLKRILTTFFFIKKLFYQTVWGHFPTFLSKNKNRELFYKTPRDALIFESIVTLPDTYGPDFVSSKSHYNTNTHAYLFYESRRHIQPLWVPPKNWDWTVISWNWWSRCRYLIVDEHVVYHWKNNLNHGISPKNMITILWQQYQRFFLF